MAQSAIDVVVQQMTGSIEVELYKGGLSFISLSDSPHSIYSEEATSMEAVGDFDHSDSEGLLRILSLGARVKADSGQISDRWADRPRSVP